MDTTETPRVYRTVSNKTVKWIFRSSIITMVIVALSSAILSFEGLQSLALSSRVPPNLAFLFPITVDTTILMGSLAVLLYELFGMKTIFGWFTVLFGTGLSVVGNVIAVSEGGLTAQILHGIIPILLCISLESLLRILRFNIKASVSVSSMEQNTIKDTNEVEQIEKQKQDDSIAESNLSVENAKQEETKFVQEIAPQVKVQEPMLPSKETSTGDDSSEKEKHDNSTPIYETMTSNDNNNKSKNDEPVTVQLKGDEKPQADIPSSTQSNKAVETKSNKAVEATPMPEHKNFEENNVKPVVAEDSKTRTKKTSKTPNPKTSSTLTNEEREKFRLVASKYLNQGHPANKVLAQIFKINDKISSADVRYIMGYDANKRVDSLVSRARKMAKEG